MQLFYIKVMVKEFHCHAAYLLVYCRAVNARGIQTQVRQSLFADLSALPQKSIMTNLPVQDDQLSLFDHARIAGGIGRGWRQGICFADHLF